MSQSENRDFSRKSFLKKIGTASAAVISGPFILGKSKSKPSVHQLGPEAGRPEKMSPNDHVNLGLIGAGGMGQGNVATALRYSGFKITAACDLYDSRLIRCRERFGEDIFITRDYGDLLDRDDIDAVIVATSDHWHDQIAIDALEKGKAVYLEKPVTQHVEEAHNVLDAERRAGVPLMVGSQRTSNIVFEKAKELYRSGEIGELNFVEGYWDRFSAMGAWQYSIPPGVTTDQVDWIRFRKDLPVIPFDPKHFFRWRNYHDYGTGVSGDLFVHLFSGMHMILDSTGPNQIYATGGLRYWDDGRDASDIMLGLFDYPETDSHPPFNLSLRVNFADGSGGGSRIRFVGSEGEMQLSWSNLIVKKSRLPDRPGIRTGDFGEQTRKEYEEYYTARYPETRARVIEPAESEYRAPDGYNDRYDHLVNFYEAVRNGQPVLQDGSFALRAAGPALLANVSQREKRVIHWDPAEMNVV
ncbi:MAG: Gfo/Idh/MocA family oxidoreductase [Balneolaceae bacterium]